PRSAGARGERGRRSGGRASASPLPGERVDAGAREADEDDAALAAVGAVVVAEGGHRAVVARDVTPERVAVAVELGDDGGKAVVVDDPGEDGLRRGGGNGAQEEREEHEGDAGDGTQGRHRPGNRLGGHHDCWRALPARRSCQRLRAPTIQPLTLPPMERAMNAPWKPTMATTRSPSAICVQWPVRSPHIVTKEPERWSFGMLLSTNNTKNIVRWRVHRKGTTEKTRSRHWLLYVKG